MSQLFCCTRGCSYSLAADSVVLFEHISEPGTCLRPQHLDETFVFERDEMADERKADDDIPETRQPPAGLTATTAGDGITRTSQPPARLTATAAGDDITRTSQPPARLTATTASDGITRTSQPPARLTASAAGDDIPETRQPPAGLTATTAGDGITRTSQPPARLTATTAGGGITRTLQPPAGLTASTPFSINFSDASSVFGGARGGGSGHRGFSPPHWRAPPTPMLEPPLGNPASRHAQTQGTVPGYAPLQPASCLIASPWQTGTVRQHGDANRQVWQGSGADVSARKRRRTQEYLHPGQSSSTASFPREKLRLGQPSFSALKQQYWNDFYVPPRSVPSYAGAPQGTIPANQLQRRAALDQHFALQANLHAETQRTVPGYAPLQPTFGLIARPGLTGTGQHDGDATRLQQVWQGSGADGSAWKRRRTQEYLHPGQSSSTTSFPREKLRPSQPSSSALEQQSWGDFYVPSILHGQTGDVPLQHAQTGYVPPRSVPSYAGAPQRTIPANQQQHRAALEQHSTLRAKLDAELLATSTIMKKPSSISAVDLGPLRLRLPISEACHISGSKACTENLHAETQGTVPGYAPLQPIFGLIASPGLTGTGHHDGDASRFLHWSAPASLAGKRRRRERMETPADAGVPPPRPVFFDRVLSPGETTPPPPAFFRGVGAAVNPARADRRFASAASADRQYASEASPRLRRCASADNPTSRCGSTHKGTRCSRQVPDLQCAVDFGALRLSLESAPLRGLLHQVQGAGAAALGLQLQAVSVRDLPRPPTRQQGVHVLLPRRRRRPTGARLAHLSSSHHSISTVHPFHLARA